MYVAPKRKNTGYSSVQVKCELRRFRAPMIRGRNLLGLLRGNIQILWLMLQKRSACGQMAAS